MELMQLIDQELSDNPALEVEEDPICPRCNAPLDGPRCKNCGYSSASPQRRSRAPGLEYGGGGSFDDGI